MIPCETAKPLNSFLKSELTLKLSDLFSLSVRFSSGEPPVCLLAKRCVLYYDDQPQLVASAAAEIQNSAFLAIQKYGMQEIGKHRNKEIVTSLCETPAVTLSQQWGS